MVLSKIVRLVDREAWDPNAMLPCQKMIDIPRSPTLQAADVFVVPPLHWCTEITARLTVTRSKKDADPADVHVVVLANKLMPDEVGSTTRDEPGRVLVDRTYGAPAGGWSDPARTKGLSDRSTIPQTLEFVVSLSSDAQRLGPGKHWLSFYATLPLHFSFADQMENRIYWNLAARSTVSDADYRFKDKNDLLRFGFANWTSATRVAAALKFANSTSSELAFSVDAELTPFDDLFANDTGRNSTPVVPLTVADPPTEKAQKPDYSLITNSIVLGSMALLLLCCCGVLVCTYCRKFKRRKKSAPILDEDPGGFVYIKDGKVPPWSFAAANGETNASEEMHAVDLSGFRGKTRPLTVKQLGSTMASDSSSSD